MSPRPMRAEAALTAAMATVAIAAVVSVPEVAVAQAATHLRLVSQKLVIAPEEELDATLAVDGPVPPGAEIAVTVSSRLRSARDDLHALLDEGGSKGGTVDFLVQSLDQVQGPGGRITLKLPTVRRSRDDTKDTLRFSATGLYPVTFELRTSEDDPIASLLTFVDRTGDTPVPPLSVALVTSVASPPAGQPDGSVRIDEQARANLEQLVAALQHNKTLPVALSLPPELLDRLTTSGTAGDQQLLQKLAAAVTNREVLSRPYVAMDPSSAARSGLADDYARLLAQGEDALRRLLPGPLPDRSLYLTPGPLDDAGLQLLRNLGTLNVVLGPPDSTDDPRSAVDPTRTVQVKSFDGSTVSGTVLDASILRRIASDEDPVLAAYHLAAELVALQADDATATGRGVVVLPPANWAISSVFLGTLEDQLARNPLLRPVTLGALFAATEPMRAPKSLSPLEIAPPAGEIADHRDLAGEITERRVRVQQVSSMLPASDPLPAEMRQLLDLSLADDNSPDQRAAYSATVDQRLGAVTGSVVATNRPQFTITSRHTTIPITVRSTWNVPLKVKVRLVSQKLNFPDGDQIVTVDPSSPPFRVPVEAKTNGTFQVTAYLLTPDGDALLGPPSTITVRSTALSGLGILVTIGAALVLAAWWLQNLRGRRRQRLAGEAAERHPTTPINRDTLPAS